MHVDLVEVTDGKVTTVFEETQTYQNSHPRQSFLDMTPARRE